MKITLKRKLTLKSAFIYLKLKTEVKREDIKNYLNGGKFSNEVTNVKNVKDVIERSVRNYLKKCNILDECGNLTPQEGIRAKETGFVEEYEEGKYQIWYTQNDIVFGNRIFHFERVTPNPRPEVLPEMNIKVDNDKIDLLPIKYKTGETAGYSLARPLKNGESAPDSFINCTWVLTADESYFTFNGFFLKDVQIDSEIQIDFKIPLDKHIFNIIPDWNPETGRCKLPAKYIKDDSVYKYFEYSGSPDRNEYGRCEYEKLPVEPYNEEEAVMWRNVLLQKEIGRRFFYKDDFSDAVREINGKDGFFAYKTQLDTPSVEEYLKTEIKTNTKEYWHLQAPLDLCPEGTRAPDKEPRELIETEVKNV